MDAIRTVRQRLRSTSLTLGLSLGVCASVSLGLAQQPKQAVSRLAPTEWSLDSSTSAGMLMQERQDPGDQAAATGQGAPTAPEAGGSAAPPSLRRWLRAQARKLKPLTPNRKRAALGVRLPPFTDREQTGTT